MNFLKRIFHKKREEKKKEKVPISKLELWYKETISNSFNDLKSEFSSVLSDTKKQFEELKIVVDELKDLELMENVTPKEIHFMEGNRSSYIKKTNEFIEKMKIPSKISINEIKEFVDAYEKEIIEFTKSSFRPFQILKNFFGEKMDEIARILKTINENMNKISKEINSERVSILIETKEKIKLLTDAYLKNNELHNELEKEEELYNLLNSQILSQEEKIKNLKKNPKFVELNRLTEALKETEEQLRQLNNSFNERFLHIEKALRKFSRDSDPLINSYLENPIEAVLKDEEFRILNVLQNVKYALINNQIEMEEKKKDKTIEKINEIDRQFLLQFVLKHNDIELRRSNIAMKINSNNSLNELNDLNYKLEHLRQKQKQCVDRINKIKKQIEKIDLEKLKNEIESDLRIVGHNIEVIICDLQET